MFQALLDPVAGNLGLSALVACVPLVVFFIMLLGVKAKAHISAVVALAAALLVAIIGFQMPAGLALVSATQGAAFGAFRCCRQPGRQFPSDPETRRDGCGHRDPDG